MNETIAYKKIELVINGKDLLMDSLNRSNSSIRLEFLDARMTLTGNFMIISNVESENDNTITTNRVYSLDNIITYRTTL